MDGRARLSVATARRASCKTVRLFRVPLALWEGRWQFCASLCWDYCFYPRRHWTEGPWSCVTVIAVYRPRDGNTTTTIIFIIIIIILSPFIRTYLLAELLYCFWHFQRTPGTDSAALGDLFSICVCDYLWLLLLQINACRTSGVFSIFIRPSEERNYHHLWLL